MQFLLFFKVFSRLFLILFFAFILCGLIAIYYKEPLYSFTLSASIAFSLWLISYLLTRRIVNIAISKKMAISAVFFSWIIIAIIGSLPYVFSSSMNSFIDAIFESVSGFTTTGSSILNNIEILPKSILFWRSLTHWIGGIGIIVLVIIIMPSFKISGYNLFINESSLKEKVHPKTKYIAFILLSIYVGLTALETILLSIGDMNVFDSICHSFGTVATGGFSPKNTSLIDYSAYSQYVVAVFMLLAGTNFVLFFYLFQYKFKKIILNQEFKFYLCVVGIFVFIVSIILYLNFDKSIEESFREAFFQVVSIVTCTGFASTDYLQWPTYGIMIMFLLLFAGGSAGSTAGGIKIVRHLVALKNIKRAFFSLNHQYLIRPIKYNRVNLSEKENSSILSFIVWYLIIFGIGTVLLIASGLDIQSASSSAATAMGGVGPGIGTVGPVSNFFHLTNFAKITLSALMIIGRLELFTVLLFFTKSFWKY